MPGPGVTREEILIALGLDANGNPTSQTNTSRYKSGETESRAVVFDAISEGEIQGLVNGEASVYLNDTPIIDKANALKYSQLLTTSTTVASNTTVTISSDAMDDLDTTAGTRLIRISKAGKDGASADPDTTFTTVAGSRTITASASFFTSDMATGTVLDDGASIIHIAGAGDAHGGEYVGKIIKYTSATQVTVDPIPQYDTSGKAGVLDHVTTISSYNVANNTVVVATAPVTAITDTPTIIYPPALDPSTDTTGSSLKRNFEDIALSFRSGWDDQTSIGNSSSGIPNSGIPNASFVYTPNTRLDWNSTFGGSTSDTTITATNVGVPDASETDQIKLTIEMPQCFAISTKSGTEYNSWLEFTCDFEYSRDGGSTYSTVRAVGPSNSDITGRTGGVHHFDDTNTTSLHQGFIIGKTKKPFQEEYIIPVEQYKPFDDWRLVIQRVNEPNRANAHHDNMNEAFIKHVESQVTDRLNYPHTAIGAIAFRAKDFSSIPKRAYHIRGKKVKVPTNYLTREEVGSDQASYKRHVTSGVAQGTYQDWDGNFRGDTSTFASTHTNHNVVYCNNPAWIFYDIVTDPRYGLGHIVDSSLVDKYALYQIARYCDELVSDGKGGLEPRFTCNVYISKATEAYKVLKDLATAFRGITYWMDGQLTAVQDRPKEPVYTFTQGNVIGGEFAYETVSEKIRPNQINVSWNNPQNFFRKEVEIVEDVDSIMSTGRIISKGKTAFGCTSKAQAHRIGKWALVTDKIENELVKFSTGVNAAMLRPGDIINIQDQTLDSIQYSGRIKAGTSTTIVTLDRAVTIASGYTYTLHLIYPSGGAYLQEESATINSTAYVRGDLVLLDEDGAAIDTQAKASNVKDDSDNDVMLSWSENVRVEKQTITTSAGTVAAGGNITVGSAFSSAPNSDVIWAISGVNSTSKKEVTGNPIQYRIMGIEDQGEGTFNIAAALYNDKKYDIIEKDYVINLDEREQIPTAVLRDDLVPAPEDVTFNLQRVAATDDPTNSIEQLTGSLKAVISWAKPLETILSNSILASDYVNEALDATETVITVGDASGYAATGYGVIERGTTQAEIVYWSSKSGNDLTVTRGALRSTARAHNTGVSFTVLRAYDRVYKALQGYEVKHNFIDGAETQTAVGDSVTTIEVPNAKAGTYTVRVRTVNTKGAFSEWTTFENSVTSPSIANTGNTDKLPIGGSISSGVTIDTSGNWDVSTSPYTFVNNTGTEFSITQATAAHAQRRQSMSGLTDGNTGYVLFDASAYATDPWIGIDKKTDTAFYKGGGSTTGSYSWWKEIGASNDGLTLCSGTITVAVNSNTVTGSSTSFSSDFSAGDLIRLGSTNDYAYNTAAWYGTVEKVNSNTELLITGVVSKAFSGKYAYKQSFKPDFLKDVIVSKVIRNSASSYTLNNYLTGPGADGQAGEDGDPGEDGDNGLRTVHGYLYYEKTSSVSTAPSAPSYTTYTISSGDINGGSGATEVLGLSDTSAVDKWTNQARTHTATSSNTHWMVRYFGTEASAGASTITVAYSNVVKQTSFTGVVTFSGGTTLTDGTSSKTPLEAGDLGSSGTTVIDGGRIDTGTIDADRISTSLLRINGTNFTGDLGDGTVGGWDINSNDISGGTGGTYMVLDQSNKKLRIGAKATLTDGNTGVHLGTDGLAIGASSVFKVTDAGVLTATSATITGAITANTGTIGGWTATNVANRTTTSDLVTTGGSGNLLYTTYIWLDSTNGQIVIRD